MKGAALRGLDRAVLALAREDAELLVKLDKVGLALPADDLEARELRADLAKEVRDPADEHMLIAAQALLAEDQRARETRNLENFTAPSRYKLRGKRLPQRDRRRRREDRASVRGTGVDADARGAPARLLADKSIEAVCGAWTSAADPSIAGAGAAARTNPCFTKPIPNLRESPRRRPPLRPRHPRAPPPSARRRSA